MFDEPGGERLAVFHGSLPKVEKRTDLGAVVFDGSAVPVVTPPFPWGDVDLAGNVLDRDIGNLLSLPGETALVLEELQEDGKAEAHRAGLVGEQRLLAG